MHRSHAFETRFVPFIASRLTRTEIGYLLDVPVALFDTSHNLIKLSIDRITLVPFEDSKRGSIENRPLIRELWVKESEDVVRNNCLRFDKLSKVTFCNYDIMTVRRILSNPPSSPEYLQFDAEGTSTFFRHFVLTRIRPLTNCSLSDDDTGYLEAYGSKYTEIDVELSTLPNLPEMRIYVTFLGDIDESHTGVDVITSVAHFLHTCPAGHQLKHMGLTFEISFYLTNVDEASQAMEDVLNQGNWAALDSVLLSMTSSITHVLKVEAHTSFWLSLEFDTTLDPFSLQGVIAENKEYLCDWGQKYLPRISASDSPNLDLKISTQHDVYPIDEYNYPTAYVVVINT